MALEKTISMTNNFGLMSTIENAYIKVTNVTGNKEKINAAIGFCKAQGENAFFSKTIQFVPDLAGRNFIAQAYDHIKTLPEFDGAVDC